MEQKIFLQKSKEEVLCELRNHPGAYHHYLGMDDTQKEQFMAFCTGKKTLPVLYDTVFKKLMHPDIHPERLEDCLSCLLKQKITIKAVLPTEDILSDGETSMVMDILVELDNGSLVLVEIQKVPYYFPAERASCYSADLLLRQYSRVKSKRGAMFSYRDLSKVYTIIFYEKSTEEFKHYDDIFVHHVAATCDTGLELNFLQEYYLVALDVFQKSEYAKIKNPEDRLAGWLSFFCTENADDAETLCHIYPWLSDFYVEMTQFGRNPEEMIGMFSEMLREMDRNTVRYMVDDMTQKLEQKRLALAESEELCEAQKQLLIVQKQALADSEKALADSEKALAENEKALAEKDAEIQRLKELLASAQKN